MLLLRIYVVLGLYRITLEKGFWFKTQKPKQSAISCDVFIEKRQKLKGSSGRRELESRYQSKIRQKSRVKTKKKKKDWEKM